MCGYGADAKPLLKLEDPCTGGLDPSVVVVYCLGDLEAELFVKDACLLVGGLNVEIDGLNLDGLRDGLGFGFFAILVLLGLGCGGVLVDDLNLFARANVVKHMLQQCRRDAKASIGSEDAQRHYIDANNILRNRLYAAADGADSDIVEETQLAYLCCVGVQDVFVEAFRVLHREEDTVELSQLAKVVGCELCNIDPLGQQRPDGCSGPRVVAHGWKRPR